MVVPILQVKQYPIQLDISTRQGVMELRQPRPDLNLSTESPTLTMERAQIHVELDQKEAWNALNGGSAIEMNNRIYSQMPGIVLQAIANKVEQGNQLAAIYKPNNTIANIIGDKWNDYPQINYMAPPFSGKIGMEFVLKPLQIQVTEGRLQIDAQTHDPELDYTRGRVDIQVRQYPRVEITPPPLMMDQQI